MDKLLPIIRRKRRPLIDADANAVPTTIPTPQVSTTAETAAGSGEAATRVGLGAQPDQGGNISLPESPSPVPDVSAPKPENESEPINSGATASGERAVRAQTASRSGRQS